MLFNSVYPQKLLLVTTTAITLASIVSNEAFAGSCCGGGGAGKAPSASRTSGDAHAQHEPRAESAFLAPHGGQLSKAIWNYFEAVYTPQETRIYVYDMFRSPVRVNSVKGQMTMRVRSSGGVFTYPLKYVPFPEGQDYLAAHVDLTRVRKGDMDVEFDLSNLPNSAEPATSFSQVYGVPSSTPKSVAASPTTAVAQQINGALHGNACCSPGAACCSSSNQGDAASCCRSQGDKSATSASGTFAQGPLGGQGLLRRLPSIEKTRGASPTQAAPLTSPTEVAILQTTPADEAAILAQRICPVLKQPLGSHGPPAKLLINNRALFVCCRGCIAKVQENPEAYLAIIAEQS